MLYWILLLLITQVLFTFIFLKWGRWKYTYHLIFVVFFLGHIFLFPGMFVTWIIPENVECGLPAFGIILTSWFCGAGGAVVVHLFFVSFKTARKIRGKDLSK